jgi:hypothetical protein
VGYQVGQQFAPGGVTRLRRNNNPLFFYELTLITSGKTLETAGIRGVKYIPDSGNLNVPDNDLVLMRYSSLEAGLITRWLWFWICCNYD